jgi:predicted SnoaL-like aldol condensation-catalyzing enzyme
MSDGLGSLCDDIYLDMYVNTELDLPAGRDTVLAFFERIQKQYPQMGNFYRRSRKEFCLESLQDSSSYRWITIDTDRLASGMANPESWQQAYDQHRLVLELAPYMLSLSHLDIDCLDVSITMDFECPGSHDEAISEALFSSSPFSVLLDMPQVKPIGVNPLAIFSLSEDSYTQARLSVESKTADIDPRKPKENSDQAISLSLIVRQYPRTEGKFDPVASFENQRRQLESLMEEKVVPYFARPLIDAIAHRRLS